MLSLRNSGLCRQLYLLSGKNFTYCNMRNIHLFIKTLFKGDNCNAGAKMFCSAVRKSANSARVIPRALCTFVDTNNHVIQNDVIHEEGTDKQDHIPVMVDEVLERLDPKDGQLYIDMTFGGGGHTRAILERAPHARVVCLDRDPVAYKMAVSLAQQYSEGQITPFLGKFSDLHTLLDAHSIKPNTVSGVLFDVGASSMQFDTDDRGFSLSRDGPLDMRMNQSMNDEPNAADVVNKLNEIDLYYIIKKYGGERAASKIAHAIIESRAAFGTVTRTKQLALVVESVFNAGVYRRDKMMRHAHVATKTFQALRIFVNNELNELNNGLETAYHYLSPGGVCVVLSFHSLEDRIVKRHFHSIDMDFKHNASVKDYQTRNFANFFDMDEVHELTAKKWTPISKRIVTPMEKECLRNPRARSAKLRAAVKM